MPGPVSDDARLARAIGPALDDLDRPLEGLERDGIVQGLADALAAADRSPTLGRPATRPWRAVAAARDFLDAHLGADVASADLEAVTGLQRYALARHFRACLGTSPHRYLVLLRLDRARSLIRHGTPLVDAALASGFADQSHMTRHCRKAYGLPPGRWAAMARRNLVLDVAARVPTADIPLEAEIPCSSRVSPPPRPASCTSAVRGPRCTIG